MQSLYSILPTGCVAALARGITLVEVLISLLIVSLILLGLLSAAGNAFYQTQTAYYSSIATQQANNIAMQIAHDNGTVKMDTWQSQTAALLPQGQVQIISDHNQYQITILWQDARQGHHVNYVISQQVLS